jgi:Cdc6-like AAA superfamily ATPase
VSEVKSIRSWLAPSDPVLRNVAETTSHLAHDRAELTCLWLGPSLARFLKGSAKSLCITGKPGSGKTVLASVINDQLQQSIGGVSYTTLFIPISMS